MPRKNMHLGATPTIFKNAYKLRHSPTPAEQILWEYLKDRQIEEVRFRRQHPQHRFVGDFYANELKLIIELDGKHHEEPIQKFADQDRSEILISKQLTILRFTNSDIFNDIAYVLNSLITMIVLLRSRKKKK